MTDVLICDEIRRQNHKRIKSEQKERNRKKSDTYKQRMKLWKGQRAEKRKKQLNDKYGGWRCEGITCLRCGRYGLYWRLYGDDRVCRLCEDWQIKNNKRHSPIYRP